MTGPFKRFASILLTMVMLLSALPAQAFAAVENEEEVDLDDIMLVEEGVDSELTAGDEMEVDSGILPEPFVPESNETSGPEQQEEYPAYNPFAEEEVSYDAVAPELMDDGIVARGEWIAELVTLFGLTATEYPDIYFPDVEGSPYFDAIMTATMHGMIYVEAGDNFNPDGVLTQEFAVRTLNYRLGLQSETDSADPDAQVAVERRWFDGSYIADAPVTVAQRDIMLADAGSILSARASVTPTSNYQFADYVVVIPETANVSVQSGKVRIVGVDGISQGTVFAFYEQGLAFVYTANYIYQDGDALCITTSDAPEGAVISAEFAGEIVPELTFIPDESVVTLMDSDGQPVVFGATREINHGKDWIKFDKSITLADGVTGSLNVSWTNIKLETQLELLGTKSFLLKGDLDVSSTVKFDLMNDKAAAELFLGEVSFGPFGYAGLAISLQMEAKVTYAYSAEIGLGTELCNGRWRDLSYSQAKGSTLSAEGKASAKISLVGYLDFGVIGAANARIGIGPVIKFDARKYSEGTPETCITLAAYIEAGASVYANFIGQNEPYEKAWPIFTEKNSPIRTYEHIEDGITVYSCTRGGSERTIKYITPAGSRYYASGNRNGSSSGIGSGGETVPVWTIKANDGRTAAVTGYSGESSVLNIPEIIDGYTITLIGPNAFQNNSKIRVVTMPDSVTEIGYSAFEGCTNLRTVDFGAGLVTIERRAFKNCTALTEANLPEGLVALGSRLSTGYYGEVFAGCTSLERVYIPTTQTESGPGNFEDCPKLNSITFGEGMSIIPEYLFASCASITHIEIPDTVTEIGYGAFWGCKGLQTVIVPDSVTEIGLYAFRNCTGLTSVTIPDSVTKIGGGVFEGCAGLTSVIIPDSVTEIGYSAFEGCIRLETVQLPVGLNCIEQETFMDCQALKTIDLPDSIVSLGSNALKGCTNLISIKTGAGLTSIGSNCFSGCKKLEEVSLNIGLTRIESNAFLECAGLKEIVLPNTVAALGTNAFQKSGLMGITLSSELTTIPSYAFANCSSLASIELPKGITAIEANAFYQDTKLTEITIPQTVTEIESQVFSYPTRMTVRGCSGSYAEEWAAANRSKFVDITVHITALSLANGTDRMTIGASQTVTPMFTTTPADTTDLITLSSDNTKVVTVSNSTALRGVRTGSANITATASSGLTYTFTVNVASFTGIEIGHLPNITDYGLKDDMNLDGLVVYAVFADGSKESVTDYTVKGFNTDSTGIKTVTVTYANKTTAFDITVAKMETGVMTDPSNGATVSWSFNSVAQTVTVSGEIPENELVYVARYGAGGRFLGLEAVSKSKIVDVSNSEEVRLIWINDTTYTPVCESTKITQ